MRRGLLLLTLTGCGAGGLDTLVRLVSGTTHQCGLRSDGVLFCWGANEKGQVGDGTTATPKLSPVQVLSGVHDMALADTGTCALMNDSTVRCWGDYHLAGDGTGTSYLTPTPVPGITGATAIVAGWQSACVVLAEGAVKCWGNNEHGELGDGTTRDRYIPVTIKF